MKQETWYVESLQKRKQTLGFISVFTRLDFIESLQERKREVLFSGVFRKKETGDSVLLSLEERKLEAQLYLVFTRKEYETRLYRVPS